MINKLVENYKQFDNFLHLQYVIVTVIITLFVKKVKHFNECVRETKKK